ncbi:hypothetical protein ZIOFF_062166 [Zingiber officinale]|uniref:CCT domain-containing protein n=1 Tax=Zingiber officinale TaxID=94328 RepID=A0A8J5KE96_ZINOF|nr:hypothetical protein ZIOFF_062166 [Zingiber officinale]
MYAEAGIQFPAPFSQGFFNDCIGTGHYSDLPISDEGFISRFDLGVEDDWIDLINIVQVPTVSEYDMGGEGDLFKAPEPILEDLVFDPVTFAMSIISSRDVITETIKAADIKSIQNDHLSDIYYDCKDLMNEYEIEDTISELLDVKIPPLQVGEISTLEKANSAETSIQKTVNSADIKSFKKIMSGIYYEFKEDVLEKSEIQDTISELLVAKIPPVQMVDVSPLEKCISVDRSIQKSISSECLSSVEWIPSCTMGPDFLDFQGLDFEVALGLRRTHSDGDIQNLGNKNTNMRNTATVSSSFKKLLAISDNKTEQRRQKLSRYREKKSRRNFGRKIKVCTFTFSFCLIALLAIWTLQTSNGQDGMNLANQNEKGLVSSIYACRKALADNQPRVRGRFAKIKETKMSFQIVKDVEDGENPSVHSSWFSNPKVISSRGNIYLSIYFIFGKITTLHGVMGGEDCKSDSSYRWLDPNPSFDSLVEPNVDLIELGINL